METDFSAEIRYSNVFSTQIQVVSKKKKKVFTEIETDFSEIHTFFPPKIGWSPNKTKKKVFTEMETDFSAEIVSFRLVGGMHPPHSPPKSATDCDGLTFAGQSNFSLHSLYYAKAYNNLAKPISASLHPSNTALFKDMSQQWRAVGNSVFDLTGLRFESQISRQRRARLRSTNLTERL